MSAKVWMSGLFSNFDVGLKQGSRTKFYGHDWNPASLELPLSPDDVHAASRRHRQGFALERSEFPEAEAVFEERRFKKTGDIFMVGPFYAVKEKLAKIFARFDLGDGGLVPFPIFKADLETPYPGEFFLLNFGCRKDTIDDEESKNLTVRGIQRGTDMKLLRVNMWSEDGDVALSRTALEGPDLWCEERVDNKFFLSEGLANEIVEIGLRETFALQECRIVGDS